DQAGLCGGVVGEAWCACAGADARTDVDDPAVVPQDLRPRADYRDAAGVVGGVHPVELGGVDAGIVDGLARLHPDAGVVDHDVQTAEPGDHVLDQLRGPCRVRLV